MKDIRTKKHGFKHSLEHDTHRNTPTIKHTHIKYAIIEVRSSNVVQIVTDNATKCKAVGMII